MPSPPGSPIGPALVIALVALPRPAPAQTAQWPVYGNAGGTRYSPAAQITPANVSRLRLAWIYRTGDALRDRGRFEANPILVDRTLYLATPLGRVVALDPLTGLERWSRDQRVDLTRDYGDFANRGVTAWRDPGRRAGAPGCRWMRGAA